MNPKAIEQAAQHRTLPRLPFLMGRHQVGSVAVAHLPALRALGAPLQLGDAALTLTLPHEAADAWFEQANLWLREQGLIKAWRNETFAIFEPGGHTPLARIERAASRFWGTLTLGAHATGYVADAQGRPSHLWIARRAFNKATDPGLFDNLIGGGVPCSQTPFEALLREGWEEAGLLPAFTRTAKAGSVLTVARDVAEGFQHEHIHCWDLLLTPDMTPLNQDGEVAAFSLLTVAEVVALLAGQRALAGDEHLPPAAAQEPHGDISRAAARMTVDAAYVTLDFLQRHGLIREDRSAPPASPHAADGDGTQHAPGAA